MEWNEMIIKGVEWIQQGKECNGIELKNLVWMLQNKGMEWNGMKSKQQRLEVTLEGMEWNGIIL